MLQINGKDARKLFPIVRIELSNKLSYVEKEDNHSFFIVILIGEPLYRYDSSDNSQIFTIQKKRFNRIIGSYADGMDLKLKIGKTSLEGRYYLWELISNERELVMEIYNGKAQAVPV